MRFAGRAKKGRAGAGRWLWSEGCPRRMSGCCRRESVGRWRLVGRIGPIPPQKGRNPKFV